MTKWIINKTETRITVHEEGNPSNYAFNEKAGLTYDGFGTITGFKFDESVVKQANKICRMLNLYELFLVMEGKYALMLEEKKQIKAIREGGFDA